RAGLYVALVTWLTVTFPTFLFLPRKKPAVTGDLAWRLPPQYLSKLFDAERCHIIGVNTNTMERGSEPFNISPFPTFSAAWNCVFKVRQSLTETSGNSLGRGHRNVSSNHPETATMPRRNGGGQHGFSLTELLIVLAIIMVVVAF